MDVLLGRRGGRLLTPPLEERILHSITRDAPHAGHARPRSASPRCDDLARREEAFIASTVREVMPIRAIDGAELPRRAGAGHDRGRRGAFREHVEPSSPPRGEGPHRHREPAAVRQGGGGLRAACASVATEVMVHTGQHYDDDMSRVFFDELGLPRPEHRLDLGGGTNTDADRAHAHRRRRADARRGAGRRARLRRHELDARGRARGRAGARPGRARRGGHALVRPRDAGGAQPRAHRPRLRSAAVLVRGARGEPARRARARDGSRSSGT